MKKESRPELVCFVHILITDVVFANRPIDEEVSRHGTFSSLFCFTFYKSVLLLIGNRENIGTSNCV